MCFLQLKATESMKSIRSLTARLLALCLALCLCVAATAPVSAAGGTVDSIIQKLMTVLGMSQSDYNNYASNYAASLPIEYDQKSNSHYVAMGGISAGGLSVVGTGNCYAAQVADKLKIQYTNVADYECNAANAVSHVATNAAIVKQADLITFQLDAAPFILNCADAALDSTSVVWSPYITDSSLIASMQDSRAQLVSEYTPAYGKDTAESMASLVERLLYECVVYCFETVNAVKEIRKYNSNAVVLVLGLYNPLRNLVFNSGTQTLDISDIMDQMIDFCNVYLLKHTSGMKNTAFVEACDASTTGFGSVTINAQDQNATKKELLRIVNASNKQYANKDGHNYMRSQVLNALTDPCKHPSTTIKNARAATCTTEGYTGDTVCASCNVTIKTGTSISKTDHKYGAWTLTRVPTCTIAGEQTRTCSVCSKKETRATSTTEHRYNAGTVTKNPGCETTGVKTYSCTGAGCTKTKTESIPATGHTYNAGTVTKNPGCETTGVKTYACTGAGCTKTKTETIPATGHKFDAGTIIKKPGCETTGTKTYRCTNSGCTEAKTETVPATGHSFNPGTVTKAPGCETEGEEAVICAVCNIATRTPIPATGHTWDNGSVTKAPGCESEGIKAITCTVCAKATTEPIPATGHSWDNGAVTTAPGCETEGKKTFTCTVCGKTRNEPIPATGHSWDNGAVTTAPGCESEGKKTFTCAVCNKNRNEPIPATGHTWNEGTVTVEPGCETEGEKAVTCTVCSKNTTEPIPATGHAWDDGIVTIAPGCETEGEKAVVCTVCAKATIQSVPATGHNYGNYLSNNDATCQKDGTKTAACSVCGATDTQSDPGTQIPHSYEKGVCTLCGTEKPSNGTIWWILGSVLIVAAAATGTLFFLKKKKHQATAE